MRSLSLLVAGGVGLALATVALSAPDEPPPPWPGRDTPEDLAAMFVALREAADGGDLDRAVAITRSLIPTAAELDAILEPQVEPALRAKILAGLAIPPQATPLQIGRFLVAPARRTRIQVYTATVDELRAYAGGTVAAHEFPPGAQRLAALLRPGALRMHEVTASEPDVPGTTRYHMFFWSGRGWRLLGPAWVVLPR